MGSAGKLLLDINNALYDALTSMEAQSLASSRKLWAWLLPLGFIVAPQSSRWTR